MDRYPQCNSCKNNKNGICSKDKKPIESESMTFGICKYSQHKESEDQDE